MNKSIIGIAVTVIVVGIGAFYGGMRYGGDSTAGQNISFGQRQQRFGGQEGGFRDRLRTRQDGFQAVTGKIIEQNEGGITVEQSDGSTKIIFVNGATAITKSVNGTPLDLSKGEQALINGNENPDGSITANTIQVNPFAGAGHTTTE